MSTTASLEPSSAPVAEDRTTAIVAYLTIIGFIVAIVLHGNKKTRLGAYHLRQSLGLMLAWIATSIVMALIPLLGWLVGFFVTIGLLVLCVMGIINAANGVIKPVPLVGQYFEKWFGQAFE